MVMTNPLMASIQKFATHNVGLGGGINNAAAAASANVNRFSGPSATFQQNQQVYWSGGGGGYDGGHSHGGHGHGHSDGGHGGGKKRSIALSALTLLAFLFFLNILQNCLEEQMELNTPQVVVMTSRVSQGKEAENRVSISKPPLAEAENYEPIIEKRKDTIRTPVKVNKNAERLQYSYNHYNTSFLNSKKKNTPT